MEGTIGEIRMFAANFAPYDWALCNGQLMNISSSTALYAIVGTYFGGDGRTTFNLPNFQSRAMVGVGQSPGLTDYQLGDVTGSENVTLTISQMSVHNHAASCAPGSGSAGTVAVSAVNGVGGVDNPGGALIGQDTGNALMSYATAGAGPLVPLAPGSIQVTAASGPQITGITLQNAGGNLPHTNIQPSLALNYIICVNGVFPARD